MDSLEDRREQGFTLIELLVVILIIAILAAIAISVFVKQREKAWGSQGPLGAQGSRHSHRVVRYWDRGNYGTLDGADSAADHPPYALLSDNGYECEHGRDHDRSPAPRHDLLRDRDPLSAAGRQCLEDRGLQQQRRLACSHRPRQLLAPLST